MRDRFGALPGVQRHATHRHLLVLLFLFFCPKVLLHGFTNKYLQTLDVLFAGHDPATIDFALPAFHDQDEPTQPFEAMSYMEALYNLRQFMTLPWSATSTQLALETSSYSVHGLKATLLSWAAQANLSETDRRLHGKHKPAHSRDDIEAVFVFVCIRH